MAETTLILPGYQGSGPDHWQTWFEAQIPEARRVDGIDWERPILNDWVEAVRRAIQGAPHPVWLVAHSFGCLTAVAASQGFADRIAGALLVAPADPERFSRLGVRPAGRHGETRSLAACLPRARLPFPSLVVASCDDPWMRFDRVRHWAGIWGSALIDIGPAGHINVDSGFGPWPQGLRLYRALQAGRFQRASREAPAPGAPVCAARDVRRTIVQTEQATTFLDPLTCQTPW